MKRIVAALLLLCPHLLLAQPPSGELEDLLATANAEEQQGRYREALELVARADKLAAAADRKSDLVRARWMTGRAHQGLGDLTAALAAFRSSLALAREIGEPPAIADNLLSIGEIHFRERRLPAAAETLRRARAAAAEIDAGPENHRRQRDIHRNLAETHAAMGSYRQAYESFRRYQELADEAAAARSADAVAELEVRLESGRRANELEIARLRQETARLGQTLDSRRRLLAGLAVAGGVVLLLLLAGLYRQRRRSSRALADKDLEIRRAAARLEEESAELERTSAELEQTSIELEQTSTKLERTSTELERTSTELEQTSTAHEKTSAELEQTSAELDQTTAELRDTGDELERKSAELERRTGLLDEMAAALEQKSNELDDDATALDRTSTELDQFRQRYRRDVSELEIRRAATEERIGEMERFVSTVSQHLKILLITVRAALASLEEEVAAGDVVEIRGEVERTRVAVGEVVRLLDRLLQLLLAGRMVHAPEEVSLSELAFEAVGQVADLVAHRSVGIVIAPDMPVVYGDRTQLLEVLRQLLENGGKFIGDEEAPRLEVGWRRGEEGTVFYVGDNGIGIEPRHHQRVFALFEQLDPDQEGDGIGLGLVQRIVEAHGGRAWVESEGTGKGTAVCFTLGA